MIRYEDLITDMEHEAREVTDFLGLEWDPVVMNYLDHARSRTGINTLSYTQVTKPVYQHGKYRWQRCQDLLALQIGKLERFISDFGDKKI